MNRIASIMAMATVTSTPPELLTNLVAYWKLDESSGGGAPVTRNDSHRSNHLSDFSGAPTGSTTGLINNAVAFASGYGGYLYCATNSDLEMSSNTSFTFSMWIKRTAGGNQVYIGKDTDSPANSRDYTIGQSDGAGEAFYIKGGGTYIVSSGTPQTVNTWFHLVCWYDSSNGQVHMRINDTTTYHGANTGATGTDVSTAEFRIGRRQYSGFEYLASAVIDEVGLWKRVLTAAEMTALYGGGSGLPYSSFTGTPLPSSLLTGLTAYYKLENVNDSSGAGATLTNNGTVTFTTGKVNNCAHIVSASSQYLSRAADSSNQFGAGDFSFAFWWKGSDTTNNFRQYLNKHARGGVFNGSFYIETSGGTMRGSIGDDANHDVTLNNYPGANDGNWHLAVVTVARAGNVVFKVDDSIITNTSAASLTGSFNGTGGLGIGAQADGSLNVDVDIDEVGLWSRALTSGEATTLWNSGAGVTYPF